MTSNTEVHRDGWQRAEACLPLQCIYFALLVATCRPVCLMCLVSPGDSQPGLDSHLQSISKDLTFEEETLNIATFHLREESC